MFGSARNGKPGHSSRSLASESATCLFVRQFFAFKHKNTPYTSDIAINRQVVVLCNAQAGTHWTAILVTFVTRPQRRRSSCVWCSGQGLRIFVSVFFLLRRNRLDRLRSANGNCNTAFRYYIRILGVYPVSSSPSTDRSFSPFCLNMPPKSKQPRDDDKSSSGNHKKAR